MKGRAVITGADGGMGFEITKAVAQAGYEVVMLCLAQAAGEKRKEQAVRETAAKVDTVLIEPDCPPAQVVQGIRSHVTFAIGRTVITDSQEMNVQAIANYLKEHPDSKASVTGYADKGTGTPEINHRLARQRAEAVRDCLVNKYGIQPERLTVSSMEGDEQPFAENDWNRVVIMIAD